MNFLEEKNRKTSHTWVYLKEKILTFLSLSFASNPEWRKVIGEMGIKSKEQPLNSNVCKVERRLTSSS